MIDTGRDLESTVRKAVGELAREHDAYRVRCADLEKALAAVTGANEDITALVGHLVKATEPGGHIEEVAHLVAALHGKLRVRRCPRGDLHQYLRHPEFLAGTAYIRYRSDGGEPNYEEGTIVLAIHPEYRNIMAVDAPLLEDPPGYDEWWCGQAWNPHVGDFSYPADLIPADRPFPFDRP